MEIPSSTLRFQKSNCDLKGDMVGVRWRENT